jgi:hypothetical protein
VNRYDIFANEKMDLYNIRANGVSHLEQKGKIYEREGKRLLSYYVVDNEPLVLEFNINAGTVLDMQLLESSFDLLQDPSFIMKKRADWMMPTPFVLTDAIAVKKAIRPSARVVRDTVPVVAPKVRFVRPVKVETAPLTDSVN